MSKTKIGIIQSRGLGDIVIALPIAQWFKNKEDAEIFWPICEEFYTSFADAAPWVKWIPIPSDRRGEFFYIEPSKRLKNIKCNEIMVLYQALNSNPEFSQVPWFQIQKFDEFKYSKASVPFKEKWNLESCLTRNKEREEALKRKVNPDNKPYVLIHLEGSDNFVANPDLSSIPEEWLKIYITPLTNNIFDWLGLMEGAEALILIDSVFANLADQLNMHDVDKYWIPRSHIHLTPVLGSNWTILEPPPNSLASNKIFSLSGV